MNFKLIISMSLFSGMLQGMQDQRERLLEHLVVNDDMSLLASLKDARGAMPERIGTCLKKLSTKHKKPHVLILACSKPGIGDQVALTQWATNQEDLSLEQVDIYYDALDHIKKRKHHLAQFHQKVLAHEFANGKKLPTDIQNLCKEYLPHTEHPLDPQRMHPEFEKAIISGDLNKVKQLIKQGHSLQATTADYIDALELATHCGKANIFRELIKHLPYINPHKQKVLLTYAQAHMIPVITKELPEHIARKNEELRNPNISAARMLALLLSGANPNIRESFFDSYSLLSWTLGSSLPKLKILLRHGANPNAQPEQGNLPAVKAIIRNDPKSLKILLEHGAYTKDESGMSLTCEALTFNSPACFRILLKHGARYERKEFIHTHQILGRATLIFAISIPIIVAIKAWTIYKSH